MTTEERLAKAEHESVEVECKFCHHILKIAPQDLLGVLVCPACEGLIEVEPEANHPTVRFDCPECGSPLEVSLHGSRERAKCPHCACDVRPSYAELFLEKARWWIMVGLPAFVSQVRRAWTQYRERRRAERAARQMHLQAQEAERAARQMHLQAQEAERHRCLVAQQRQRAIQLNTSQRLVVVVGVLALMAMCAYPPHSGYNGLGYNWLWVRGSIDTARLGLQLLLVAGATGLLAYGLRPAAIQALAKRKKLLIVSVVVAVTVGTVLCTMGAGWEDLYWWWHRLPAEQVSKISVVALLTDKQVGLPPATAEWGSTDPIVEQETMARGIQRFLNANRAPITPTAEPPWEPSDPIVEPPQQQPLLVKNGSGEALRAISIRIYYPGVPVPSTHDRLPCFVSPGGETGVTVWMEHDYTLPLRVEVVEASRQ